MTATRSKYSSNTLKDTCYAAVLERIIHDEYKAGDIITEKSLVDEFGISKSPVREALVTLCNEKLLKSIPRFGYEVVSISDDAIKDMLDYRIILECGCLDRNWDLISEEQIKALEELLYKDYREPEVREALEHWEKNKAFHLTLCSFSRNRFAYEQLEEVIRALGIAYVRSYWKAFHYTKVSSAARYHKEFVRHLIDRNKQAALEYLQKDIAEFFTPGN